MHDQYFYFLPAKRFVWAILFPSNKMPVIAGDLGRMQGERRWKFWMLEKIQKYGCHTPNVGDLACMGLLGLMIYAILYSLLNPTQFCIQFPQVTKTARKNKIGPPIKYLSFTSSKNLCVCHYIDLYIRRIQSIRIGEDQMLVGTSPHKAVSTQNIIKWLIHILSLAGIDIFIPKGHSTRAASTSKAKVLGVLAKEILERGNWSRYSTFQKHYCKDIIK